MGLSQSPAERAQRLGELDAKLQEAADKRDSKLQNITDTRQKIADEEGLVRDQQLRDVEGMMVPVPGEPGQKREASDEQKAVKRQQIEQDYQSRVARRNNELGFNGTELQRGTALLRSWGNGLENTRRRLDEMGKGFGNFWRNNIYGKQTLRDDEGNLVTRRTGAFAGFGNMRDEYRMWCWSSCCCWCCY
jgi:hypothetical protein